MGDQFQMMQVPVVVGELVPASGTTFTATTGVTYTTNGYQWFGPNGEAVPINNGEFFLPDLSPVPIYGMALWPVFGGGSSNQTALNTPSLSSQAAMVALHDDFEKFPDICNPGVGVNARVGTSVISGSYDQGKGFSGSASIQGGPVSVGTQGVSVSAGEALGGTVTVNPLNHTVSSVGIYTGIKTKMLEFSAEIHAAVVNMFACTN